MHEELLHFLWNYQLFSNDLQTIEGEKIKVLRSGDHNHDAGPDFLDARIVIGNTLWAGNVEMHLNSSDWLRHKHQKDAAYENVILHVVLNHDKDIWNKQKVSTPTIEVSNNINHDLIEEYKLLMKSKKWVSCQNMIDSIDVFKVNQWLQKIVVERLERKTIELKNILDSVHQDWDKTFFIMLLKYFGGPVNKSNFEFLASQIDLNYLYQLRNNQFAIEAIIFGRSGLLESDTDDAYYQGLKNEYLHHHLKKKWNDPIELNWKFMRMRPLNFPTIRIAQLSSLIAQNASLVQLLIERKSIKEVEDLFTVNLHEYWLNHYRFGTMSSDRMKPIGAQTISNIIINVLVPFLFVYGRQQLKPELEEYALDLLYEINAENNQIIRKWSKSGITANDASQSQALIELKQYYCDVKACLNCGIGIEILKS